MWMKQHRNKCNIMGTIHCAPQTLLAEQAPWASATPALTTKDPFTGTETFKFCAIRFLDLLLTTKDPFTGTETSWLWSLWRLFQINNEGPLYGDGNLRQFSVAFVYYN